MIQIDVALEKIYGQVAAPLPNVPAPILAEPPANATCPMGRRPSATAGRVVADRAMGKTPGFITDRRNLNVICAVDDCEQGLRLTNEIIDESPGAKLCHSQIPW